MEFNGGFGEKKHLRIDFGDHKSESCYISVIGCDMMCSVSSESQVDLPKVLQLQSYIIGLDDRTTFGTAASVKSQNMLCYLSTGLYAKLRK